MGDHVATTRRGGSRLAELTLLTVVTGVVFVLGFPSAASGQTCPTTTTTTTTIAGSSTSSSSSSSSTTSTTSQTQTQTQTQNTTARAQGAGSIVGAQFGATAEDAAVSAATAPCPATGSSNMILPLAGGGVAIVLALGLRRALTSRNLT